MSELLTDLEANASSENLTNESEYRPGLTAAHRNFQIQKLLRRLKLQEAAMARTVTLLEDLASGQQVSARLRAADPRVGHRDEDHDATRGHAGNLIG